MAAAPPAASAPAPVMAGAPRLSAAAAPAPRAPVSAAPPGPIRRPPAPPQPEPKKNPALKWAIVGGIVLVLGGGLYIGIPKLTEWQNAANAKRREIEKNSDGGQMGHIANLYDVLDATEPGGRGLGGGPRGGGPRQRREAGAGPIAVPGGDDEDMSPMAAAEKALPVVPPVYTLDVKAAQIPQGRVNGLISGSNFVADIVSVDPVGTAQALRFIQGKGPSPDRELLVYLHLKAGETVAGHNWTISSDMKGLDVPQVAKRWKPNPKFAAETKSFPTGYAMKLELGQLTNGAIAGKIFVALPDSDQSVVAGLFNIPARPVFHFKGEDF